MTDEPIRVVLAEDHAVVREGTAELLERAGIEVVGQASNGLEAVDLVRTLQPDVLVLDLSMAGGSGLDAIEQVRSSSHHTGVLVLTAHEDEAYVRAALERGAMGYLSKAARGRDVVEAVRTVAAGRMVLPPELAAKALTSAARGSKGPSVDLTPRERDVLAAAARGLGNKQIAAQLGMSPRTVQTHLTHVFAKLGVASRTEAVLRAIQEGRVGSEP